MRCFWHSLYMKDVHANGGTNDQDLCQTLAMIFKVIKSDMPECTWTENDQLLDIIDCPVFTWKKYKEEPLPSFKNLQQKSQKIIIHSLIYKWLIMWHYFIYALLIFHRI
jgi:hypothetical protein